MSEQSDFAQKLKSHIDKVDAEIRRLDAKLKVAEAEGRQRLERSIGELWAQRGDAESRLEEIMRTSNTAWDEVRTGVMRAFDEINAGFRRARERAAREAGTAHEADRTESPEPAPGNTASGTASPGQAADGGPGRH